MGIVQGQVVLSPAISPFEFFLDYCQTHGITINSEYLDQDFLSTWMIPDLRIYRADGVEIAGEGAYIECLKDEECSVTILGVPYPFYAEEFPHHYKTYEEQFKSP